MINVKDELYAALTGVADNVSDVYPKDWERFPVIQYTEEENRVFEKTDKKEDKSYVRYRVDIWNNRSTSEISVQVDEAIAALGLTRIACGDVADPSGLKHKVMRYEGIIDNKSKVVYWNG